MADSGFPRQGTPTQEVNDANLLFDKIFVKNCTKGKEIGTQGSVPGRESANDTSISSKKIRHQFVTDICKRSLSISVVTTSAQHIYHF